jgi:hypothetical protein
VQAPFTRFRVRTDFSNEIPLTQQHFKDECDINTIVNRYRDTGEVTHLAKARGEYAYASSQSFSEAAFIVAEAKSEFEGLPSRIRAHFNNDAAEFLDAAQNPDRDSEMISLGLLEKPPEPAPEPLPLPLVSGDRPGDETSPPDPAEKQPDLPEKGAN